VSYQPYAKLTWDVVFSADALSALLDEKKLPHQLTRIGIRDRFGESGDPEALLESLGLAGESLLKRLREAAWR
jgi:transketolase C-terminal domain/subunit